MPHAFDVLIVGGGLVGSSLALALAPDLQVGLIETSPHTPIMPLDERALVLSEASCRIFKALGLWKQLAVYTTPIQTVHVSAKGCFNALRFLAADYQLPALGHVIPAHRLTQLLQQSLVESSHIKTFYATELQAITPIATGYQIHTNPPITPPCTTHLLVGADGSNSITRNLLTISTRYHDYSQTACVATVEVNRHHQNTAFERFIENEVLAILPYGQEQIKCIWTVDPIKANNLKNISDSLFCTHLQAAFGYRAGRFLSLSSERKNYPLYSLQAISQIYPHAVLLGNAAHTLHPVAAQGFNLSLRDVAVLAAIILDAKKEAKNPGGSLILEKYQAARIKAQTQTLGFTRFITDVFNKRLMSSLALRETALFLPQLLPFIKHKIAKQAMGIGDDLPDWVSFNR